MKAVQVDRVLSATPASLSRLRTFLAEEASKVDVPRDCLDAILLAANEMAANAVEHSGTDSMRIRWQSHDGDIAVTVTDGGVSRPRRHSVDGRGFGFSIADILADEVRVSAGKPNRPGTTVRLLFRRQ